MSCTGFGEGTEQETEAYESCRIGRGKKRGERELRVQKSEGAGERGERGCRSARRARVQVSEGAGERGERECRRARRVQESEASEGEQGERERRKE